MRRKHHEQRPPAALDEPFGPPPEEYRYRCPVCGEEMWVNEAIIDVRYWCSQIPWGISRRHAHAWVPRV